MGNRLRHDQLSILPLSIIHLILARLPIRDAIRTSFLSRQWRYTWITLPRLHFNCTGIDLDSLDDESKKQIGKSTNNFITNVLLLHKGPINRFKMSYPFCISLHCVEAWILCLSRNDIRELIIRVFSDGGEINVLKSSVYSCTKLIKLELRNFKMVPPPSTFKGFLSLATLVLEEVELSPEGVESLLGNCPLLERLKILCCLINELRIRSPSLKDLEIAGYHMKLHLCAPLLVNMDVGLLGKIQFTPKNQRSVCNYSNFFFDGGFTNLVDLGGHELFIRYLSIGIESCHSTLVFHRLKVIKLSDLNLEDAKEIGVVAHLIIGAPNLHKLYLSARLQCEFRPRNLSSKDYFGFAPSFTLEKLTYVSLSNVCDYRSGMQLVEFLLERSPVLEAMELLFLGRERYHNVSAELLGFGRASPNAKILVI